MLDEVQATKGTLDWAYPPPILAGTAAAGGMRSTLFFTFYGLNVIHPDFERKLKVSPVGSPALPIPNLATAMPGMGPVERQPTAA